MSDGSGPGAEATPAAFRRFDPAELSGVERYKLLIGAVVPRPIALVSTIDADKNANIAPFSFYNAIGSSPMLLQFCPANAPDGSEKDSLRNAAPPEEGGTGEFVVNVTSEDIAIPTAVAAEPLPSGESEWDVSGLRPTPSERVAPARVADAVAAFECVTDRVLRFQPGEPSGSNMVIGRVVLVHIREDLVNERLHVDQAGLDAVGRMGGIRWCRSRDQFELMPGVRARSGSTRPV